MESQNILSGMGPTRITESNCWPFTEQPQNPTTCPRALPKSVLPALSAVMWAKVKPAVSGAHNSLIKVLLPSGNWCLLSPSLGLGMHHLP